jgi:peptide/nickel transport system substrate-binding protein
MDMIRFVAAILITVALCSCAPTAPGGPGSAPGAAPAAPPVVKIITIATLVQIKGFGPWDIGSTTGGWAPLNELHSVGLVADATRGGLEPRLAAKLPSLDDGSIRLLPDGRMQTTWQLRPGIKWHDGAPFTAADLALSVQLSQHPELPKGSSAPTLALIESAEVADPLTITFTWKSVFTGATALDARELWPYPSHLLAEAFQGDKQAFQALPYFTTNYVGLGPFRLVDFGIGDAQTFERFADYYLGRPKLDRVIIRAIPDANTLLTNIQAGSVDIVSEQTIPHALFLQLRDAWSLTGDGAVLERQGAWRYAMIQHRPDVARQPQVARDIRLRRGLIMAIDREALREFILPGLQNTSADSFMSPTDPRAEIVGRPFARYRYDVAAAAAELAEAGWRPGPDGRIVNAAGDRVDMPLRTTIQYPHELAIIADYWRKLGLEVPEEVQPPALRQDAEYNARFTGSDLTGRTSNERVLPYFDSRLISAPENRWRCSIPVREGHLPCHSLFPGRSETEDAWSPR